MVTQMEYLAAATHRLKLRVDVVVFGSWDPEHDPAVTGWEMYDQRLGHRRRHHRRRSGG
jgi:hypothetical protein